MDVTVKEENYQQSTRHWGMQIKPPTQGMMNGTDISKNLNNIGFDLGLFCGLQGLISLEKNGAVLFFGQEEGGVEACAKIKNCFETFAAVNVCTTGTAFRVPFLIYACLYKFKPVYLLTLRN